MLEAGQRQAFGGFLHLLQRRQIGISQIVERARTHPEQPIVGPRAAGRALVEGLGKEGMEFDFGERVGIDEDIVLLVKPPTSGLGTGDGIEYGTGLPGQCRQGTG